MASSNLWCIIIGKYHLPSSVPIFQQGFQSVAPMLCGIRMHPGRGNLVECAFHGLAQLVIFVGQADYEVFNG